MSGGGLVMRQFVTTLAAVIVIAGAGSACATKKFVRGQVEDVRAKLDELANKLKSDPAGNYIEIEGHTDSTGTPDVNDKLGLARAENVKRYLYETYQIPLHKINVISYGEAKPVAPNKTREG